MVASVGRPDTSPESWRLKSITDAYLCGFYREKARQKAAGEQHDQDKCVRAGSAFERAVTKVLAPPIPKREA